MNGILGNQLHACDDVALHEGTQVREEWLALVLSVEFICHLWSCEFAHLQSGNGETVLVYGINNFSGLGVTVWFDQGKCSLGGGFKLLLGEEVAIINELELA